MIKVSKDTVKAVIKHLELKYEAEGRDFFFKSKHLSKEIKMPAYSIGRAAMIEAQKGGHVEVIRHPGHGACLFRTCFRKEEKDVLCETPTT
jgi:hypothetical protein